MTLVLALAASLALSPVPEPSAALAALPLLGVWEPTVRVRDLGTTLELCADGSLNATTGIMLDFAWRRDGESGVVLVYTERTTGQEISQPYTVRFESDGVMVHESGPSALRFTRAEPARAGGDPIAGLWTDTRFGKTAYTRFSPDGSASLRIPSRRDTGTYKVEGDRMTLELHGQPPATYKF
ncbi:MAG TPA: hypothetical protein VIE39_05955, partial [Thermoanaerobaculia bacterium]